MDISADNFTIDAILQALYSDVSLFLSISLADEDLTPYL